MNAPGAADFRPDAAGPNDGGTGRSDPGGAAAAQWERVQELFAVATGWPVDLPRAERDCRAAELCGHDPVLVADLLSLLDADAESQTMLDGGVLPLAEALVANPAVSEMVEQQIGPYRLLRVLGEGGMGVVYLAERTDIGGLVAIKLLRDAWLSPMRLERFHIEQRTLARLNHPGIARVYDSGTMADGTPWFVMEYAEGEDLGAFWAAQTRHSVREALRLMCRVCDAVQYAHSHAIIHRDLKPTNIVVTPGGEVKLLDFGISKELDAGALADAEATRTVLRLLTPGYAAPEQHTGAPTGVFSDVYSLGVVLYELLTGQLPRPRTTAPVADHSAFSRPVVRPSELVARALPAARSELTRSEWADLDLLCLTALQPDPARRYSSVDALSRDIDHLLSGRPLQARPDTFLYVAGKFVRRQRRTLAAIAAVLLLVATIAVVYSVRLRQARNVAVAEAERARRQQQFTEELFDGGDAEGGPKRSMDVSELLERGRKQADSLQQDPDMQADMRETLGGIYGKLGRFSDANPLLEAALDERRAHPGDRQRKLTESLVALSGLRREEGRYPEAEKLAREALLTGRAAAGSNRDGEAEAARSLGSVLAARGSYDEARGVLEFAIGRERSSANAREEITRARAQLADVLFYQGDYASAETLNLQVLAARRGLYGDQHPAVADTLNNLGSIALNRAAYAEAESFFRQNVAILEGWYGPDHPEVAANLHQLASAVNRQGHPEEARALLDRALRIDRAAFGPVHPRVALALNQLGVLLNDHDQNAEAEADFKQALSIDRQVYGERHPFVAQAYSNLAGVYLDEKDYPRAEEMCRKALAIDRVAFSEQHPNTAIAEVKLGRILVREARFAEAEPYSAAAYAFFRDHAADPSYLRGSRKDLAVIEDKLGRPEQAARYRAELAPAAPSQQAGSAAH